MNFKKILSLFILVAFGLTLFSGCGEKNKTAPTTTMEISNQSSKKIITMVGGNEEIGFWQAMKKGAGEAAEKYGYTLDYIGVDDGTVNAVTSHVPGIGNAVNKGTVGVVIAPEGEGYSEIYSRLYDEKILVVQVGYLIEEDFDMLESNKKNPISSTVTTDYKQAGAICAEMLFEKLKEDIKKSPESLVVGVIERDDSLSDEEKADGFVEKFTELADSDPLLKDKYRIETESEGRYEDSFNELTEKDVKAVFFTHQAIADRISDVVMADKEQYKGIVFCGFDSGAKQLKWLTDEKEVQFIGGVAQDAYNLGYNAVEQCVFAIENKAVKEEVKIEGKWYDKENMDKMKQENIIFEK